MKLFLGFEVVLGKNNRYGAQLFAVDSSGRQIGGGAVIVDPIYAEQHEVVDALVGGIRGMTRSRVTGIRQDELRIRTALGPQAAVSHAGRKD